MATSSTPLLGLALPVTGELSGTWGDVVNNSLTSLVDSAVAGTTTISTDADVTLTTTTLAANESRQAILLFSGARTAQRTVTAPARSKTYVVINATTGGFAVKLVGVGPTTGVIIPSGKAFLVTWNGTDFVVLNSAAINLSTDVTGTLPVANGGTGASTLTGLLLGNGTSAVTAVAAPAGAVVGTTETQTLTNKRVTPRIVSITTASTITPTADTADQYNVTALAASTATIAAPSGTPTDGQKLILRILDDGTSRTLVWTTSTGAYRAVGTSFPIATAASKVLYVGCIYNAQATYWDVVSVVAQS